MRPITMVVSATLAIACSSSPPAASPDPRSGASTEASASDRPPAQPPVDPSAVPIEDSADAEHATTGGWLGVEFASTPPDRPGVTITGVIPRSPAAQAGLVAGDVLVAIDGRALRGPADLVRLVGSRGPGERLALAVDREGRQRLLAATLVGRPDRDAMLRMAFVDAPAPAFEELKTVQGSVPTSVGALAGDVVVVEFWATWCQVCPVLVPVMNRWHAEYGAQGVRVVGITAEPVLAASRAAEQLEMRYPLLSDHTGRTTAAYRATALPMVFVIDRRGKVRDVMVGFDPPKLDELERLVGRLVDEG